MSEQRETRILMISPDSKVTPDQLVRAVHTMVDGLSVKETCYGCLVESSIGSLCGKIVLISSRFIIAYAFLFSNSI